MAFRDKLQKWWSCDFYGGMADPINYNMFFACLFGAAVGLFIGILIYISTK